jgi:rod shape determining protein RodA
VSRPLPQGGAAATAIQPQPSLLARLRPWVLVFDPILFLVLLALAMLSLVTMYSAAYEFPGRLELHARNLLLAGAVMWVAAVTPREWLLRAAVPLFVLGVLLLIAVALVGDVTKGARRWLNLGFIRIQPSELLKIALPLMFAWYFQYRQRALGALDFLLAGVLLALPVWLILRQPDLGTALLVASSGLYVIFLAGLSWKVIAALACVATAAAPLYWQLMHDYQRQRVLTFLDPTSDPLGNGFHIIQSTIAIGSGGLWGKGWMQGTQTHLEFIPERTTDFILAVYSEEFGLMGNALLITLYLLLVLRSFAIASAAASLFHRLLAGAMGLVFFTYAFVNIGMVSGVLPVVGVPLPLMSYGGTAMVTLGIGLGLVMAAARERQERAP